MHHFSIQAVDHRGRRAGARQERVPRFAFDFRIALLAHRRYIREQRRAGAAKNCKGFQLARLNLRKVRTEGFNSRVDAPTEQVGPDCRHPLVADQLDICSGLPYAQRHKIVYSGQVSDRGGARMRPGVSDKLFQVIERKLCARGKNQSDARNLGNRRKVLFAVVPGPFRIQGGGDGHWT